jgi:hypothetical protein
MTAPAEHPWIAVCGPGRQLLTALILALDGTTVTEIRESPDLPDPEMIVLINPDVMVPDLPPFEFKDLFAPPDQPDISPEDP